MLPFTRIEDLSAEDLKVVRPWPRWIAKRWLGQKWSMALPWGIYLYAKAWDETGKLKDELFVLAKLSHEFVHRRRQGGFFTTIWWFLMYLLWPWARLDEEMIATSFALATDVIFRNDSKLRQSAENGGDIYADAAEILYNMNVKTSQGGWRRWYFTPGSPGHHVTNIKSYAARIVYAYYMGPEGELLKILHTPRSELAQLIAAP